METTLHTTEATKEAFDRALIVCEDRWLPANGGTEEEFTSRSGIRMLYCYNPGRHLHAYLNVDTDIIMTQEEAEAALELS